MWKPSESEPAVQGQVGHQRRGAHAGQRRHARPTLVEGTARARRRRRAGPAAGRDPRPAVFALEPRGRAAHQQKVLEQQARAGEQHQGQRHLRDRSARPRRRRPPRPAVAVRLDSRRLSFRSGDAAGTASTAPKRRPVDERQGQGEHQHPAVDIGVLDPGDVKAPGQQRHEQPRAPARQQQAEQAAGEREHRALGQQLLQQPLPAGAQGRAEGQLLSAARRSAPTSGPPRWCRRSAAPPPPRRGRSAGPSGYLPPGR